MLVEFCRPYLFLGSGHHIRQLEPQAQQQKGAHSSHPVLQRLLWGALGSSLAAQSPTPAMLWQLESAGSSIIGCTDNLSIVCKLQVSVSCAWGVQDDPASPEGGLWAVRGLPTCGSS